jgi:hypothetical protein
VISASWQIEVARTPEDVFDFVSDLSNEPKFNPDASNIVKQSDGPIGLGTVYTEDFRRIGAYTTTIDRFERPSELGFDARNPKCDALVRFTFAPAGEGSTTVGCTVELTFKGAMKFMGGMMSGTIRKEIEEKRGPMLKAALESPS